MDMEKGYPVQQNAPPYPTGPGMQPQPQHTMYPNPNIPPQQMPMPMPQAPPTYETVVQQGYTTYQPVQTQPTAHVVQTTVIVGQRLGPEPQSITCPSCRQQSFTRVDYEMSTKTHLWAAVLCLFGLWPCVCIPYCIDSCKNGNHYCNNCNAYLGSYKGF